MGLLMTMDTIFKEVWEDVYINHEIVGINKDTGNVSVVLHFWASREAYKAHAHDYPEWIGVLNPEVDEEGKEIPRLNVQSRYIVPKSAFTSGDIDRDCYRHLMSLPELAKAKAVLELGQKA